MKNKLLKSWVLLLPFSLLIVNGCTVPSAIKIFNNTGSEIIIEQYSRGKLSKTHFAKKGGYVEFRIPIPLMHKIYLVSRKSEDELLDPYIDNIQFRIDTEWEYEEIEPPVDLDYGSWATKGDYVDSGSSSQPAGLVLAQIDKDGKIHLLKKNMVPPTNEFPEQFGKYPVSPAKTEKYDPPIEKFF